MNTPLLEIEGTWEEIIARAPEFKGQRLRVTTLPPVTEPLAPKQERMLRALQRLKDSPLTEEEETLLEGMQEYRRQHPFTLNRLEAL